MGLSNGELAAILRLRDDAARAVGANRGAITAALKTADQTRNIVNSIKSQFRMADVKTVADAFVGLTVFDPEQFSGGISARTSEQFKMLNSTVDHLAGLKVLMPPDHLSATIANSLIVKDAAIDALRRSANLFKSCEMPDYAKELRQFTAMSHASARLLQTISAQHGFADLLGVHDVTRSLVKYETGRLNRAYAGFGTSIARRPERLSTELNRPGFPRGSISWEDGVHGKTEEVLTGGSRAGGPVGVRPRTSARLAVGGDPVSGGEDRVHVGDAPPLGPAGRA